MKTSIHSVLGKAAFLVFAVALALGGAASPAGEHGDEKVLQVYAWVDFFDSAVISDFEEAYGCRVELSYFHSNEAMFDSLQNSGETGYDLITPSSYMSDILWKNRLIQRIDHSLIPNLALLDPQYFNLINDSEHVYSVPYTRSVGGIGYKRSRVRTEDIGSWGLFDNPAYAGKMTILNDSRESIGAALKYLGYSLNSVDDDELAEAELVLRGWLRNGVKILDDQTRLGLYAIDGVASYSYNSDTLLESTEDADVSFFVPREGASLVADDFAIPTDAVNAELAHRLINFILEPENAKRTMEGIYYLVPVAPAVEMLDDELKNNPAFFAPTEVMAKSETILDVGEANDKYEELWERILAAYE